MYTTPGTKTELDQIAPGTVVDHPAYGTVTVAEPLDRGELTNLAGFPAGTWIIHPDRGRIAVWGRTPVQIASV